MAMPDHTAPPPAPLLKAARRVLRPLVRMMMRSGITYPVLADVLRTLFVEVASTELLTTARSRTDSRISLMTGVHRKEIRRLREVPMDNDAPPAIVTISSQVIARWLGTPAYQDASHRPIPLPRLAGPAGGPSFEGLLESVTTDIRPRSLLDGWLEQGIVTLDANDRVHLNTDAFIPRAGGEEQMFYFGRNLHDHVAAAVANIGTSNAAPYFDRSLHYDGMTPEAAARLIAFARDGGMRALVEANQLAASLTDGDIPPPAENQLTRKRVNFGVYVYSEDEAP